MQYTFIFGKVAIIVRYWEERYDEIDAGARVDVRMVESYEGEGHRPGASGYRILPVSEGGIWRIDLQHRLDSDDHEPRYHHHPEFQYGDVGPRAFDQELADDPIGWTEQRLLVLPALLEEAGLAHLGESIDTKQLAAAMPMIRQAIEISLQPN